MNKIEFLILNEDYIFNAATSNCHVLYMINIIFAGFNSIFISFVCVVQLYKIIENAKNFFLRGGGTELYAYSEDKDIIVYH